ncbi:MAG: DUF4469 domain-containing protein [Anaerolineae bacterium]|nr:DUF4469 domain-containing protein [Anaerolineae bacterium]
MIDFALYKNTLTNGKKLFKAVVLTRETLTLDDVMDRMMQQGTTVTRQDIIAVLDLFFRTVMMLVLEGHSVLTPLVNLGVSIKGVFNSQDDTLDKKRHEVKPRVNANKVFKDVIKNQAQFQQQKPNRPMPQPTECTIPTSTDNSTLTPGGGMKLSGYNLQFDESDPAQGIFLVAEDQTRTRVQFMLQNTARELIFLIPNTLTPGPYTLEVKARYGNDNIRTGVLETPLAVPEAETQPTLL